ncbi:nucleoside recognition domain-containing protein [Desulfovibrio mangrovi]|uniref:nucleoside recognition domain-containing protein n=1 Tax=Desulfovibrio mangrovi TaxID=2976983 RepID=UPI0022481998|nr:nucleoside recognition domain-containing protein [Desulfovibrio mangrovi]UZP67140.1 nucleoside recognition domain-containing protein [Desulfovibrio mangrovi]
MTDTAQSFPKESTTSRPAGMRRKRSGIVARILPFALCAGALVLIIRHDPALLAWAKAWPKLIHPLLRMLLYLGVGLLVGLAVEGMGWAPMLARVVRPLMRFGNLRDESGAAFTAAFFSGTTANTMLMNYWQDGRITQQEMRLSYLVNTGLPVFLLHLPTTFFIVVPMTRTAGIIYLSINALAALLRTIAVLAWSRIQLSTSATATPQAETMPQSRKTTMQKVLDAFGKRFRRIITITAPVYFLMYALNQTGAFDYLRDAFSHWAVTGLLPVEAAGVVVFSVAAEFTSGIAAAGALLDAGTLTTQQIVLALILGTIVATPIRALRHQLPSHAGVFTPKLGLVMLLQSQFLRITSLLAVTWAYLALA